MKKLSNGKRTAGFFAVALVMVMSIIGLSQTSAQAATRDENGRHREYTEQRWQAERRDRDEDSRFRDRDRDDRNRERRRDERRREEWAWRY